MRALFFGVASLVLSGCSISYSTSSSSSVDLFEMNNYSAENKCDELNGSGNSSCKVWRCFGDAKSIQASSQTENILYDLFLYGDEESLRGSYYHDGKMTNVDAYKIGDRQEWIINDVVTIEESHKDFRYTLVDEVIYSDEGHVSETRYTIHDDIFCYISYSEESTKII